MDDAQARLFIALWPGPAVRESLRAARDAWQWPAKAALVATDKLHLTLHFIGGVPRERVGALAEALRRVPAAPFELRLSQAALWRHGVAVLEPARTPARLAALHGALAEALRSLGLAVEARPFRPHVTLARHAIGATLPTALPPLRWHVRGHALVESRGGAYVVLGRYGSPSSAATCSPIASDAVRPGDSMP